MHKKKQKYEFCTDKLFSNFGYNEGGTNFSSLGGEKKGDPNFFSKILGGTKPYALWILPTIKHCLLLLHGWMCISKKISNDIRY